MSERGWRRSAAAGGAVSVVLVVASGVLESGLPRADSSTAKIASYYADESHWHRIEAGVIVGALSMLFFLWFLSALYARLRTVEGGEHRVASMALAAGVAFTGLFGVLGALRGAIGETLAHSTPFREAALDPQLVRMLAELGVLVYVAALVVGAVMIAASSVLTVRAGALSAWLGPVGALISLIVLVGAFILPSAVVYLLLFWVLSASVSLTILSTDAPAS